MNEKFIRDAEKIINLSQLKEETKTFIECIPTIAELAMAVHKGFIEKGFSEAQAFSFTKDYILKLLFQNR